MKRYSIFILVGILAALWVISCNTTNAGEEKSTKDTAIEKCIRLCKDAKGEGRDLSNGPLAQGGRR